MITYRQSRPSDAPTVSKLLLEVSFIMRFLYNHAFNQGDLIEEISVAFKSEDGKSSYKNIYVAEIESNHQKHVIGLVCYYDSIYHKIDEKMKQLFPAEALNVIEPLMLSNIPNSFYISALIVDQAYRNHNIGPQLIQHVVDEAKKLSRKHVCLHVWDDNQRGIHFYKKNNFTCYNHFTLNTDSPLLPASKKLWLMVKS